MKIQELSAVYDARQSFYGKAKVIYFNDVIQLQSYNTVIGELKDNKFKLVCDESALTQTTLRHLKEFLLQYDFNSGTKRELIEMYK